MVTETADVVLIGGGIMSATLSTLLSELQPDWKIVVYERLHDVGLESTNAWNNAGTGHAALCELNYTPERADGTIDISKAVTINEQFELSRELWNHLSTHDRLPGGDGFLSTTPHMTFVRGADNADYLRRRFETLRKHPLFSDLEFSTDPAQIARWAPLLVDDRDPSEPVAATRAAAGTDVDFGRLTRAMVADAVERGARLHLESEITKLRQKKDGTWSLRVADRRWNGHLRSRKVAARFVFIGAGGGALTLLQSSGIPEAKGFGGFPISGQFLKTTNPDIAARPHATA